jgi:hypothetical protein
LMMTLYPEKATLTSVSQDGIPIPLSQIAPIYQTVTYGNNVTIPNGGTGTVQPGYGIPYSNIGVHIGITVKFPQHDYNKGRKETTRHYRR